MGRLGNFRLLAVVNNAAANRPVKSAVSTAHSNVPCGVVRGSLGCASRRGIARATDLHSGGYPFAFPATVYGNPNFATASPKLVLFLLFCFAYNSLPTGCEVASHGDFDLHFPNG